MWHCSNLGIKYWGCKFTWCLLSKRWNMGGPYWIQQKLNLNAIWGSLIWYCITFLYCKIKIVKFGPQLPPDSFSLLFNCQIIVSNMFLSAFLYLGPGLGGGVIAMVVAFLVSLLTFIVAVLWYPIKKIIQTIKKWRNKW